FALAAANPLPTPEAQEALGDPSAPQVLKAFLAGLSPECTDTPENANAWLTELRHALRDSDSLRGKQVMFPIRAALTGSLRGPCLGIITSLLGPGRCRERVQEALDTCCAA
ncbi:MAG: hypothetical protein ACYCYF_11635, partial [Anaerolineae bacterium]